MMKKILTAMLFILTITMPTIGYTDFGRLVTGFEDCTDTEIFIDMGIERPRCVEQKHTERAIIQPQVITSHDYQKKTETVVKKQKHDCKCECK